MTKEQDSMDNISPAAVAAGYYIAAFEKYEETTNRLIKPIEKIADVLGWFRWVMRYMHVPDDVEKDLVMLSLRKRARENIQGIMLTGKEQCAHYHECKDRDSRCYECVSHPHYVQTEGLEKSFYEQKPVGEDL